MERRGSGWVGAAGRTARRPVVLLLALCSAATVGGAASAAPASTGPLLVNPAFAAPVVVDGHRAGLPPGCRDLTIPVSLPAASSPAAASLPVGAPSRVAIRATYCRPVRSRGNPRAVEVLIPGGTYNRRYWNWPVQPERYSYLRRAVAAGRAVLAYDRPGTGDSGRPPSAAVTLAAEAYVLHQLVGWLHVRGFRSVTAVGNSFGSVIAVRAGATYRGDLQRLVLTGYLHAVGPPQLWLQAFHPAREEPRFADAGYDDGYLTTLPGMRGQLFYGPSADPDIVASDEATKDVLPKPLLVDGLTDLAVPAGDNASNRLTVPVLLALGDGDLVHCAAGGSGDPEALVRACEAPYFTGVPRLDIAVFPDTGHLLTLHPSAPTSFEVIDQWIAAR